ncbi:Hpt domain-containing protein [Paraburkholderia sp. BCC1884]|uniref:Hpt domain-containing protein n=1 Tax=Paraburkholderia sp. BCC1884 TaxID=2562668 RepID=UPI0016433D9C|nr:Hpt domain-containing protein [Paraburkholderia sp. BCC1884]
MLIDTDTATLKALLDAFHASNWDAAATASHRITGSLRMLDEARLIDLMSRFEAAIRAREIDDARSHLPRIVESFGHLLALLQKLFDSAAHP